MAVAADTRPRVFVLTDIGTEPDDAQSMVRFLVYSNELRVEGLVATTSRFLDNEVNPQQIRDRIHAYGQVRKNLLVHAPGYPTADELLAKVASGLPVLGMKGVGAGKDSAGSELLIRAVDASSEPLWVTVWGGPNVLAQALFKVRSTRSAEQVASFVARLRVYAIEDQDDSGAWIRSNFPSLFYMYGWSWRGISDPKLGGDPALVSNAWIDQHVQNHGVLGSKYPHIEYIMEGDTPSWLYLVPTGLNDPQHPEQGGWGGRYVYSDGAYRDVNDTFEGKTNIHSTVYRWRPAFQNDFQARMDWTISSGYGAANHPPVAAVSGELKRSVRPGALVQLDASGSSAPAAESAQKLSYKWTFYDEPSSYDGALSIQGASAAQASFVAPNVTSAKTIHVVLAVTDNGVPALTRYQRVIVTVDPNAATPPSAPTIPVVNAGADQTIVLGSAAALDGTVVDDKLLTPPALTWSMLSGPGTVTFQSAGSVDTSATFSAAGTYVLRLTASDTAGTASDDLTVTVALAGQTRSFVTGINFAGEATNIDGNAWQSFGTAMKSGLSLSGCWQQASTSLLPTPAVAPATSSMLNSALWISADRLAMRQSLANGTYYVSVWVMENHASNYRSMDLQLEGTSAATGIGSLAKGEWKKYGPYPTEVKDGVLDMALVKRSGASPHVMGIEISR